MGHQGKTYRLDFKAALLCCRGSAPSASPAQSWQRWDGARKVLGLKPSWHFLSIHAWGGAPAPSARPQAGRWAVPPCHAMPPEWHRAGFGWQTGLDPLFGRAVGAAGVDRGRGRDRNPMPAVPLCQAVSRRGGEGGGMKLRSPPASTCPQAPRQRSRNKEPLFLHNTPLLATAPASWAGRGALKGLSVWG